MPSQIAFEVGGGVIKPRLAPQALNQKSGSKGGHGDAIYTRPAAH